MISKNSSFLQVGIFISAMILLLACQNLSNFPTPVPRQKSQGNHISNLRLIGTKLYFGAGYCLYQLDVQTQALQEIICTSDWTFNKPNLQADRIYTSVHTYPDGKEVFSTIDMTSQSIVWDYEIRSRYGHWRYLNDYTSLVDNHILLVNRDGIYGFNINSGELVWSSDHNWMSSNTPLLSNGNLLLFVQDRLKEHNDYEKNGSILAIDPTADNAQEFTNLLPDFHFEQIFYLDNDQLVGLAYKQKGEHHYIVALNLQHPNEIQWSSELLFSRGEVSQVVRLDDTLVIEYRSKFYAFDINTGQRLWFTNPEKASISGQEAQRAFVLQATDASVDPPELAIIGLDVDTGDLVWEHPLEKTANNVYPLTTDDTVFVGNKNRIEALDVTNGNLLWMVEVDSKYEFYEPRYPGLR